MPRTKPKPDPLRKPPIPLTDETRRRFADLNTPTETEQPCGVCHAGRDVPKVHKRDRLICIVCNAMLGQMSALERKKVLLFGVDPMKRLPYYRAWFQHPERSALRTCTRKAS